MPGHAAYVEFREANNQIDLVERRKRLAPQFGELTRWHQDDRDMYQRGQLATFVDAALLLARLATWRPELSAL